MKVLEVKNVRTESKNLTHKFTSNLDTKRRELLDYEKIDRKYPDWSTEREKYRKENKRQELQ